MTSYLKDIPIHVMGISFYHDVTTSNEPSFPKGILSYVIL